MNPRAESRRRSQHRHAAMRGHAGGSDDHGQRARSGRGEKDSVRLASPPREPCRSPSSRGYRRHHRPPRLEDRQHSPSSSRHRSRSHDRVQSSRAEPASRGHDAQDLIPRYRASKVRYSEPGRRDAVSESPASAKRNRSRSPASYPFPKKRPKQDRENSPSRDSGSRKRRRHSSHDRRHVLSDESEHLRQSRSRPQSSPHSQSRYNDVPDHHAASKSRRSSRPPPLSRSPSPHPSLVPSPSSHRRHPSVRRASPPAHSHSHRHRHLPNPATGDSLNIAQEQRPPRHAPPHSSRSRHGPSRRESSLEPYGSTRSDIDDDMASRGGYRGGHNPLYSHPPNPDPHSYSPSPQHGNSYHNSPSISPYGQFRGSWSGQFSPQQPFQSQYPHHGQSAYGPHNGPPEHYNSHHHSNSSLPPYAPSSGSMPPYQQGGYRENYRGGSLRRNSFSNRGGYRGSGPPNPPRGPSKQTPLHKASERPPDDGVSRRLSTRGGSSEERDAKSVTIEPSPSRRASREHNQIENNEETQLRGESSNSQPQSQSLVSGSAPSQPSASGKFSFSFKSSSKPTPTAPRPEISQRFNAAPRREPEQSRNHDREPPRSAPTEPASSRQRPEARGAPTGSRMAPPRTRKVKKTVRRLKERPTLPPDLAASESVFFRKPGNESVVGSGTYGKVFKGLNVYTKGLVALKRIRMEGERDGFPVTAVREIKLLQSLRHTNIVKLQEVMVEKNDCFMVFEYLSHDLTGLLNHPSFKLDPAHRKHLARQLFEGLNYLHTRGVLHRDIKAANILVSSQGVLKLADFGLARFYAKRHQLDYTNRVITIWYRSPELLLGETQYTAAVDVWSAACVMVEIFTQHAIFAGDGTELSQLEKIYSVMGTPTRQEWPGLVRMAWFELLRPTVRRKSVFAEKYKDKLTPAAFDLLSAMFRYDPTKRPTAADALQHAYFTSEEPPPRQAVELASIDGEWHEFESKALRKENERREREARRASKEKDKKRGAESQGREKETKRVHVDAKET
ncbi:hypothetical protein CDD82_2641 [Ophiocordyceps australis]|uniref:cyclin-dependent kinase n=1 Tax=Ophiocordyceps australis TaxID=1399860 RepID=A0A2C5Y7B3_9HYPO|nr:hypothetical protein CDD82_2641 [Ophiocordyceps australis]